MPETAQYYADKIGVGIMLAPIARLTNEKDGVLRFASQILDPLNAAIHLTHFYDIIKMNDIEAFLASGFCKAVGKLCVMIADNNYDFDTVVDNANRYDDKMAHQPAGAGWRTLIHYGQVIKSEKFQRYDYGDKTKNM